MSTTDQTTEPVDDPRPGFTDGPDGGSVTGWRCTACRHPVAQLVLYCPVCRSPVAESAFAPTGEVWASTCLRVRVPGRTPPFAVAYLVLDDGPRVLVHTQGDHPQPPGSRARVTGVADTGDLVAEPEQEELS
ncbi:MULTISPECIES: OB-fold domain-containing protein [Prauserella salsuginis group]|uniref:ChsH2 C-terminal OB-fold domain-containing protein n=2 Tax=Prauserella salsuginis group TaxID=2893672 RepID=A0A839XZS3_9PSEU|nr:MULTISPECIES: OB-fold domain-containing protein [Prauserella salsuginis group]MBB3665536.1 hypothetical protein [Prauserella sediminis]MCR3718766.1 hypothetical protein [Prauserella flava]MCR3733336.1 hypothetical protein [Prauserella salsuginis]